MSACYDYETKIMHASNSSAIQATASSRLLSQAMCTKKTSPEKGWPGHGTFFVESLVGWLIPVSWKPHFWSTNMPNGCTFCLVFSRVMRDVSLSFSTICKKYIIKTGISCCPSLDENNNMLKPQDIFCQKGDILLPRHVFCAHRFWYLFHLGPPKRLGAFCQGGQFFQRLAPPPTTAERTLPAGSLPVSCHKMVSGSKP